VTLGVIDTRSTTVESKKKLIKLTPRSTTEGSGRLNVQIKSAVSGLGTST